MNNKVWTYVIEQNLNKTQLLNLLDDGKKFVLQWTAHEHKLEASFEIFKDRIIVVKVNEDVNQASGCSIDKLAHFIKEVGAKYNFAPLNRLLVALKKEDGVEVVPAAQIKELLRQGSITENTIVYNTAIATEAEYASWEQALKNTWLNKYLV